MNSRFDDNQPQAASQLGKAASRLNLSDDSATKRNLASATGGLHTVQHGENLHSIAQGYGLSAAELAAANDFGAAALLMPGQSIRIPQIEADTATVRELPQHYQVATGKWHARGDWQRSFIAGFVKTSSFRASRTDELLDPWLSQSWTSRHNLEVGRLARCLNSGDLER